MNTMTNVSATSSSSRLAWFQKQTKQNRFWWFARSENIHLPAIYRNLTDEQFDLLKNWFDETEHRGFVGECNIPLMSFLVSLIDANSLDTIVQLGHFSGYSSLFIGWALQAMGKGHLISLDINEKATKLAHKYITRAGLEPYVRLVHSNSLLNANVDMVREKFGSVKLLFIDSSHVYGQTLDELSMWVPVVQPGGLVVLHDVSHYAKSFDRIPPHRGVHDAVVEWRDKHPTTELIMLNKKSFDPQGLQDGCGWAVAQIGYRQEYL